MYNVRRIFEFANSTVGAILRFLMGASGPRDPNDRKELSANSGDTDSELAWGF
jgi:hypothetical protein